jgi:hypothetical protein
MLQEIQVVLTAPDGSELDLTERLSSIDDLSQAIEEDLLEFVHDDISLELDDRDGDLEALLANATADDIYEMRIWRTLERRRAKRQLLFAGMLDLPWSLSYDRKERTASIQLFAYSKLLEKASAENVKRDIGAQTGSVTGGTKVVTLSSSGQLVVGDEIRLTGPTAEESQEIATVDSSTQVTTVENWTNTITSGELTLITPYYRNRTVEALAADLFTEAGISDYQIQEDAISAYPVATEINKTGLPVGNPLSIVDQVGAITATFPPAVTTKRKTSIDPQGEWSDGATSNATQGDWRPYLLTEPASILAFGTGVYPDDGGFGTGFAWDHAGSHRYQMVLDLGTFPDTRLSLEKDGATIASLTAQGPSIKHGKCEYEPTQDEVWIAWDDGGVNQSSQVRTSAGVLISTLSQFQGGAFRCMRDLGVILHHSGTTLSVIDPATRATVKSVTTPADVRIWTARYLNGFVLAMYTERGKTRMIVWDSVWTQLTTYELSDQTWRLLQTVFEVADGRLVLVGYAGDRWFVASTEFAGVIPYADFHGKSCSAALRDLALASLSVVTVDHFRVGYFLSRQTQLSQGPGPFELDTPLSRETRQLSEQFRTSVKVTGKTEQGEDIEIIGGDTGESQRRLELDSDLITTSSLAQAVAEAYSAFLSRIRREEQVTIQEDGELLAPLRWVVLDGIEYQVMEAETDVLERVQDLRLIEVVT